ncbi:MAG: hypothetical protein WD737_11755 [Gemmatimonadota bacterium]
MPIPNRAQFQKSTNLKRVFTNKRASDTILKGIDALIDTFHLQPAGPAQAILLGKLYYATEAWLKKAERGEPGVHRGRKSGVYDLYVQVVQELSAVTGVPINLLPNWLAETFGKSLVEHGAELDIRENLADYLSEVEVRKFRLRFKGGVAYQQQWWTNKTKWVPASSANVVEGTVDLARKQGNAGAEVLSNGFSGYVLSQGGDFYSGPHFAPRNQGQKANTGRYHSSYFGGEAILSAGEIKIENGRIIEINTNSGHYQPGPKHVRMAVETLALHGVKLDTVWVAAFGQPRMRASEYLAREGLNFTPADKGLGVPRQGWANHTGGNTPASRARVAATLGGHRMAQERRNAFTLFKLHCKPKSIGGVHGPGGRDKCAECRKAERFWPEYLEQLRRNPA